MSMASTALLQARCAENIAVMALLGEVPVAPERNQCSLELQGMTSGRTVSLQMEKDLVNTLGFLSSVKDDPNKVTAVCVQEMESSLCVMVAANARNVGDSPYLQRVKAGFDKIFSILGEASRTSHDELEQQVFKAIVAMCHDRILTRARLDGQEAKPSIQSFLREASGGLCRLKNPQNKEPFLRIAAKLVERMDGFSTEGNDLPSGPDKLTRHNEDLEEIVEWFYELSTTPRLAHLLLEDLDSLKPKMDPCSRKSLLNNIEKIAQYRSSATRLAGIARACSKARRASTLVISLEPSAFERYAGNASAMPTLRQTLARIAASSNANVEIKPLCNRLEKSVKSASQSYKATIENTTVNSKIHAEIQLISYLDTHPALYPPRIIASNKDACFFCNEFIAFHGKYTISRSHGRIYPGWRLPATAPADVQQGFNARIEGIISRRISHIMENKVQKTVHPLESTVFSAAASMDTLLTTEEACEHESDSDDTVTPGGEATEEEIMNAHLEVDKEPNALPTREVTNEATTPVKGCAPHSPLGNISPHHGSAAKSSEAESMEWQSVSRGKVKCGFASDILRVYVEYTTALEKLTGPLYFRVKQGVDGLGETSGDKTPLFNVGDDTSSHDISWCKESRFVKIKAGDQLLTIELDSIGVGESPHEDKSGLETIGSPGRSGSEME